MNARELYHEILKKRSCLCVGLDTDPLRIPAYLQREAEPLFTFNRLIVDATIDMAIAYKPNLAFYEAQGPEGMRQLEKTVDYIRSRDPKVFIIADAKRGDIGNTAELYARAFFIHYDFDAVTLSPYMGRDSIIPFLQFEGKWAILLALTSNPGAGDFQLRTLATGERLFERVMLESSAWGTPDNLMYVVGATQPAHLQQIREILPGHFLLIPGVGAQGGSLDEVLEYGWNSLGGLLINNSRGIIYAGQGRDFDAKARHAALEMVESFRIRQGL
ncbi:MAG: orotidine-5'-phosphate decarboxylase [Bacteroidales bacterium]